MLSKIPLSKPRAAIKPMTALSRRIELLWIGAWRCASGNMGDSVAARRERAAELRTERGLGAAAALPPSIRGPAPSRPASSNRTIEVIDLLKLRRDDTRRMFESVAGSVGPALKLPCSPTTAWRELSTALVEAQG
jgi:hypothetical protein